LCVYPGSLGSNCKYIDKRISFCSQVSAWRIQGKVFRVASHFIAILHQHLTQPTDFCIMSTQCHSSSHLHPAPAFYQIERDAPITMRMTLDHSISRSSTTHACQPSRATSTGFCHGPQRGIRVFFVEWTESPNQFHVDRLFQASFVSEFFAAMANFADPSEY
jgi:hypothetical protein